MEKKYKSEKMKKSSIVRKFTVSYRHSIQLSLFGMKNIKIFAKVNFMHHWYLINK